MNTYIAVLRGINVSGHNLIKMTELKAMFESIGFENVITYIQSGNVVFSSEDTSPETIADKIRKNIYDRFGLNVPVIVLGSRKLKKIISGNPFPKEKGTDEKYLHVTLLSGKPSKEKIAALDGLKTGSDNFIVSGNVIYLYCPGGYGNTKLSNTAIEKKLGVTATTRNWKTMLELERMSANQET